MWPIAATSRPGRDTARTTGCATSWLAACLVAACAVSARAQAPESPADSAGAPIAAPVAIVNVNLVPMGHDGVVPNQTVLTRAGRIAAIGAVGEVTVPDGAMVVEGAGRYLLPGLTDAHVHLETMLGCRRDFGDGPLYLSHGVTTVFNLRGKPEHLDWKRRIQAGEWPLTPNLYSSGEFVNEPRVHTPEEVDAEIASQVRSGWDLIKHHQVVDDARGRYTTTRGLDLPTYMRMCQTARAHGIPLVGHIPEGLDHHAVLAAGQSLSHINELVNIYFLPASDTRVPLMLVGASLPALFLAWIGWGTSALVRRMRGRTTAVVSPDVRAASRLVRWLALAALLALGCGLQIIPFGAFAGNPVLLLVFAGLAAVILALALRSIVCAVRIWHDEAVRIGWRVLATLVPVAATGLTVAALAWLPILWRSTDGGIAALAQRCRESGMWVQTTLVIYETGLGLRDGYRSDQVKAQPVFRHLPAALQKEWQGIDELIPRWLATVFRGQPAFTRRLTVALHRAGVPLMAGTDAMGLPLLLPGVSLRQELHLLAESGLTPYDVLWTATAGPAKFLGRDREFGTIAVGRRADLLLVAGNPLEDLDHLDRPEGIMLRGRWLPRAELERMMAALVARQ